MQGSRLQHHEDAERRLQHREEAIRAVKRALEYRQAHRRRVANAPRTPDPTDTTISKRKWELGVQQWRQRLRELAGMAINNGTITITSNEQAGQKAQEGE